MKTKSPRCLGKGGFLFKMSGLRVEGLKQFAAENRRSGTLEERSGVFRPHRTTPLRPIIASFKVDSPLPDGEDRAPFPAPEKVRSLGGARPIGKLAETLDLYEAPESVKRRIARRAGELIGSAISHDQIEEDIQQTMRKDGLPKWPIVETMIYMRKKNIYQGRKSS